MTKYVRNLLGLFLILPLFAYSGELDSNIKKCEQSDYVACAEVGIVYYDDDNAEYDKATAMKYFKKMEKIAVPLCEQKDAWACYYMAELYETIEDFNKSSQPFYEKSVQLLIQSCKNGKGQDCNELGAVYNEGNSAIKKDKEKTRQYYKMACDVGFSDGCYNLGLDYAEFPNKDDRKSVEFYDKACQLDDMEACGELGVIYMQGRGDIDRNDKKADTLLTKACKSGNDDACKNLEKLKTVPASRRELDGIKENLDGINNAIQNIFSVE
ncbi:MAG: sel1 repeat family protein [Gammaproteobacteria bacterium]|nr:sel1 repeat family protein [Gammaproteobacteria bacterium]